MADQRDESIDLRSGFDPITRIFHSLRPKFPLPHQHSHLSCAHHAISLRGASPWSSDHDAVAFIDPRDGGRPPLRLSYAEFSQRVAALLTHLRDIVGLRKGDTAFVLSPNTVNIPVLYFSLLSLGVVVSPANPAGTESEISRQVGISSPVIAFADSRCIHKLPALRHGTIVLDSPEFESVLRSSSSSVYQFGKVEVKQSDVAAILYSSGTTGLVKGVALTHRNLIANMTSIHATVPPSQKPAVLFSTVPYFHVFGFSYLLKSIALCETSVIMERFQLDRMLAAVEEFGVTHIATAPPVVVAMAKRAEGGRELRSLMAIMCGGAPTGRDVISAFNKRFPNVMLLQGYGLTESSGGVFRSIDQEESSQHGSTGKMSWSWEARIVDPETGESLAPCKEGELWIRGPTVMKGYVGDPEATSATITADGWLKTGDLSYINEEGFLYVVDRLKELIKYKGYQVAPAELEQLLQSHPEIADAAVIPFPDEEAGQIPMAFVARKHGSDLDEAGVIEFIEKQVAPFKKIRRVEFVSGIPRSAAGKILRKDLRKTHLSKL